MKYSLIVLWMFVSLMACNPKGPEPILLNKDACTGCKMSVSEGKFATELVTDKGRVYKFDDIQCMKDYIEANPDLVLEKFYVGDYSKDNELIDATQAWYVQHEEIRSPMGGHTAAFSDKNAAAELAAQLKVNVNSWDEIQSSSANTHEHHH